MQSTLSSIGGLLAAAADYTAGALSGQEYREKRSSWAGGAPSIPPSLSLEIPRSTTYQFPVGDATIVEHRDQGPDGRRLDIPGDPRFRTGVTGHAERSGDWCGNIWCRDPPLVVGQVTTMTRQVWRECRAVNTAVQEANCSGDTAEGFTASAESLPSEVSLFRATLPADRGHSASGSGYR